MQHASAAVAETALSDGAPRLGRRSLLMWSAASLALAGCAQISYEAPTADVAGSFDNGAAPRIAGNGEWWRGFQDAQLNALIDAGMARNLDVRQAVEAINEARAAARGTAANDLPQVSGAAAATRGDPDATGYIAETTSVTGNVSWLIDLFGANRAARDAAAAKLDAAYLSADVARLVMQSGIANAYIDLRYYQSSIALTRKSLESRENSLDLTRKQFDLGATDRLAVIQAEQLVAEGQAQLPAYETGFEQALARLATLTAGRISDLRPKLQRGAAQPRSRFKASVGVPAEVVRARPDVQLAERNYAAAVFAIGVAKAAFYPSVTLSGNVTPINVVSGSSLKSWSLGPAINLPIFSGGANTANLRGAESRAVQAKLAWESAVLSAIEEVETGLAAYRRDGRNIAAQQKLVDTSAEAVELSRTNFSIGEGAFFTVLDAERTYLSAQQSLAAALQQSATNYVTLSAAAAGGTATAR